MNQTFEVTQEDAGQRLDVFCVTKMPEFSRAAIQREIKNGHIQVDHKEVKPKAVLAVGQTVTVNMDDSQAAPVALTPVPIPIVYEDKDVVVINKPAGIAVHPGQGLRQYTVVDWVLEKYPEVIEVGDMNPDGKSNERPGIIHRLDKDTSGALIIAKTQKSFEHLKEQFKRRQAKKEYLALVFGTLGESSGRIVRPLMRSRRNPLRRTIDPAGKEAITEWRKEESFGGRFSLLRVYPLTGRTHQIRVHLHFLGFPIVGDELYTFKRQKSPEGVKRQLLHAEKLTVAMTNGQQRTFVAPLAEDFALVLKQLRDARHKPA